MAITTSYSGAQGWEVTTTATGSQIAACFAVTPTTSSASIHHIILANNIANGCASAGITVHNDGDYGVDYLVVAGNAVYNAAKSRLYCFSGISVAQLVQTGSLPGTHIYIAGNVSWDNVAPGPCNSPAPTGCEGIIWIPGTVWTLCLVHMW